MLYITFQQNILSGLAIFSNSHHIDSRQAWILSFWSPAALSCYMWNLSTMGAVVSDNKSFEWT